MRLKLEPFSIRSQFDVIIYHIQYLTVFTNNNTRYKSWIKFSKARIPLEGRTILYSSESIKRKGTQLQLCNVLHTAASDILTILLKDCVKRRLNC